MIWGLPVDLSAIPKTEISKCIGLMGLQFVLKVALDSPNSGKNGSRSPD